MKKILPFALMLALSSIPRVYAPTDRIEKSKIEKILEETKIINEDLRKLKTSHESYERQIEDKRDYSTDNFNSDKEEILFARMLLGEVPHASETEKIGVIFSVINRLNKHNPKRYGEDYKKIILKEEAYSAFLDDRNYLLKKPLKYFTREEFKENRILAKETLAGKYKDPTNGATHYANPNHPDLGGKLPWWAKDPRMKKIGRIKVGQNSNGKPIWSKHIFYEEKY
jgi:hypothetical protein